MSKEITQDILKKINQIKQEKAERGSKLNNQISEGGGFMGFDISKEGLSEFRKNIKDSNAGKENPLDEIKEMKNSLNTPNSNLEFKSKINSQPNNSYNIGNSNQNSDIINQISQPKIGAKEALGEMLKDVSGTQSKEK